MKEPMLKVTVGDGKYTLIQEADGRLHCLRHWEPWRDCVGDNLILSLGYEVEKLRQTGEELKKALEVALLNLNCANSCVCEERATITKLLAEVKAGRK